VRQWFCEWPGELAHVVDEAGYRVCGVGFAMKVDGPNALSLAAGRCANCERMARHSAIADERSFAPRMH